MYAMYTNLPTGRLNRGTKSCEEPPKSGTIEGAVATVKTLVDTNPEKRCNIV